MLGLAQAAEAAAGSQSQTMAQRLEEQELLEATANLERLLAQSALDESAPPLTRPPRLLLKLPRPETETIKSKKRKPPADKTVKSGGEKRKRVKTDSVLNSNSNSQGGLAPSTSTHLTATSTSDSLAQPLMPQTQPHNLTLSSILFFDLFFDFIIAPSLDTPSAPDNLSRILSRTRIGLYKYMLLNSFFTMLQFQPAQQPHNIDSLFLCFTQCAQSLGLAFS